MELWQNRVGRTPDRLSPVWARRLIGLAAVNLVVAVGGALAIRFEDGWAGVAATAMLMFISLGNFCWGLGSLIEEERGGKMTRSASVGFSLLMFLAMFAWLGLNLAHRL